MAKLGNNPIMQKVTGQLGKTVVYKQYDYGTVVSKYPDMSNVKPSDKQKLKRERFGRAVVYAKAVMEDPEKIALLEPFVKKGKKIYHAALSHYLRTIEV